MIKNFLLILTLAWGVMSATYTVAGFTSAAIQAQINNCATTGDTVIIPEGRYLLNQDLTIYDKGIVIKGEGQSKTVLVDTIGVIRIRPYGSRFLRISNLQVDCRNFNTVVITGDGNNCLIDRIFFRNDAASKKEAIWVNQSPSYITIAYCKFLYHNRVVVANSGNGNTSWKSDPIGTSDNVFVESCYFHRLTIPGNSIDANAGGRYVFRKNIVVNSVCEAHSLQNTFADGTFQRATRSFEIYNNTFISNSTSGLVFTVVFLRGGSGVVFGNTVTSGGGTDSYNVFATFDNTRSWDSAGSWFSRPIGMCDGDGPYDGNIEANGYPCLDQPGMGTDAGPTEYQPQTPAPIYLWDNTFYGGPATISIRDSVYNRQHIVLGRDVINNISRPNYVPYPYPHPITYEQCYVDSAKIENDTTFIFGRRFLGGVGDSGQVAVDGAVAAVYDWSDTLIKVNVSSYTTLIVKNAGSFKDTISAGSPIRQKIRASAKRRLRS